MSDGAPNRALRLDGVSAGYGATVVLEDLDLALAKGESISVIGRNGVGKTTLLATVMGHTNLHGGNIEFDGAEVSAMAVHRRARAGIGYVPQEREVFPSLSVRQNLMVAEQPGRWTMDSVFELFPQLRARSDNMGNQLSGGEQQMLAIGRALIGRADRAADDRRAVSLGLMRQGHGRGPAMTRWGPVTGATATSTILLVEQNTRIALDFSARAVVMDRGRIVFDGASQELKDDPNRLDGLIGVAGG